jgi:hypothetical protein
MDLTGLNTPQAINLRPLLRVKCVISSQLIGALFGKSLMTVKYLVRGGSALYTLHGLLTAVLAFVDPWGQWNG